MQLGSVKNCRHGMQMNKKQEVRLKIGTSNKNSEKQVNLKTGGGILGKKHCDKSIASFPAFWEVLKTKVSY